MYATFHFKSAEEINDDVLIAIKAAYKSKAVTLTVEEDDSGDELSSAMKKVLDERLLEDESTYITAVESINQLNKKYGL